MQHVWEFLARPKPTKDYLDPLPINRTFVTDSGRRAKATLQMIKEVEKVFGFKQDQLENFFVRKLR